jgi:hypothetical protein
MKNSELVILEVDADVQYPFHVKCAEQPDTDVLGKFKSRTMAQRFVAGMYILGNCLVQDDDDADWPHWTVAGLFESDCASAEDAAHDVSESLRDPASIPPILTVLRVRSSTGQVELHVVDTALAGESPEDDDTGE